MRENLFWLSDEQWKRIEPHLPTDVRGVERAEDRRVISGIVHVLKSGCRWCDCPPEYGPPTTIYNRFVRLGSARHLGKPVPGTGRVSDDAADTQMIDSTHVKAHRSAAGGKGGAEAGCWPLARRAQHEDTRTLQDAKGRLLAILLTGGQAHDYPVAKRLIRRVAPPKHMLGDTAYDGDGLREELDQRGTKPVIPNHPNRKHPLSFNKRLYKLRWRIESAFNRLKDFRRIATRYDRLARNYLASVLRKRRIQGFE